MWNPDSKYFHSAFLKEEIRTTLSPTQWWKSAFKGTFNKTLENLIESIFIMPASTGAIERNFSTLGNIITNQRNRLSVPKAEKLCVVNNYYKLQHREEGQERKAPKRKFPN